jgi:hypothetical protein
MGEANLCKAVPLETETTCMPLGYQRLASFSVHQGKIVAVVDKGVGEWEPIELSW